MAKKASPRYDALHPKNFLSAEESSTQELEQTHGYVEVVCGDVVGELYLEKLRRVPNGKALEKCICSNNVWYTSQEFESKGGKKSNKAWKKSIKHKGKPLQIFFCHRGTQRARNASTTG